MSHVRSQIRETVKTLLTTEMPDHRVFAARRFKINSSELPMIDMRFLNENNEVISMSSSTDRTGSLYVRVSRTATEDEVDDLLDDDAILIEHAMAGASNPLHDLVVDFEYMQTNFTDNADGDKPVAELILRYDIVYRTDRDDVETAKG